MITCPECGKRISDKAAKCPHCGIPREDMVKERERQNKQSCSSCGCIIFIVLLILIIKAAGG